LLVTIQVELLSIAAAVQLAPGVAQ